MALAALTDHYLQGLGDGTAPAALAGGVGLAGLVIFGRSLWPAILLGELIGAIAYSVDAISLPALISAGGNVLAILVAASFILRMHLPPKPDNLNAMLRYIAFGAGTVAVISAVFASLSDVAFGDLTGRAALAAVFPALFISFAWTLAIGSLLQSCWSERRQPLPEKLIFPVLAIAAAQAAFLYFAPGSIDYIWCVIPLLVWAGIVGKVRGAAIGLLLVLVPTTIAYHGSDMLPADFLWPDFAIFLCIAGPTALLMAALNMESSLHRRSQMSLALGNPHEGRFEYYPSSRRFKIDQDVKELLGIASEGSVIREAMVKDVVHPKDSSALDVFLDTLRSAPSPELRHVEFRVFSATGAEIWLEADGVSMAPQIGPDRAPAASFGVIRNISQMKESEQRLLDSDRFLHSLIENLVTFVAVLKPDGTVVETNRPQWQVGREDTDSVIGQKLWEGYWCSHSQEVQEILSGAVTVAGGGRVSEHDLQMRLADDVLVWMEVQIAPLKDEKGAITHLMVSGSDLTERLKAEAQARRMAAIIESTPDFVGITGPDNKFIYVSPGGQNLVNAPEDMDFFGKDFISVHPKDQHVLLATEALPAARSAGVWEGQTELLTVDGQRRPVSQVILGHFDQQGELQYLSTVMRDMSEQKKAEEQQRILLRELAHRVKNTLAVIQGFTRQTLRRHPDPENFARVFEGRIASLAASHNLLTDSGWHGAQLRDVIETQLLPSNPGGAERVTIDGPDVTLPSEAATTLGLILHELATNATQHGGWAGQSGHVSITWSSNNNILSVEWRETDIQAATDAMQSGFGSSLLDMSVLEVERHQEAGVFRLNFKVLLFTPAGAKPVE